MKTRTAILLLIMASHALPENWRKVEGVAEGVFSIAVNPRNQNTIWVGGAGKIFVSYDGGRTIGRTLENLRRDQGLGWILIHPVDTSFILIGGGRCLQSRDNGRTWSHALPDTNVSFDGESVAFEPGQPDTLYVGLLRNRQNPAHIFFRSFDRGTTWIAIAVPSLPSGSGFCSVSAGGGGLLLGGTTTRGRVARSTDYGASWNEVYRIPDSTIAEVPKVTFDKRDGNTAWATIFRNPSQAVNGIVLKSSTRGLSWTEISLPGDPWAVESDPYGRVYVGMFVAGLPGAYVSFDGGGSWKNFRTGFPAEPEYAEVWMIKSNSDPFGVFLADGLHGAYKLQNFDGASVEETRPLPRRFVLSQNYPNPFNPETVIPYALAEDGEVELTVLNVRGESVRRLSRQFESAGSKAAIWDGKDQNGVRVSSGVYLCSLRVGKEAAVKKMLLVR